METKRGLLKWTDSYWDLLPPEMEQLILKIKESQERIEWRESLDSRELCYDIKAYGLLMHHWFIGPIQCRSVVPRDCDCRPRCFFMQIFGYYWTLNGEKKRVYLGGLLERAIARCSLMKFGIDYQTNPSHSLSVCSLKLF